MDHPVQSYLGRNMLYYLLFARAIKSWLKVLFTKLYQNGFNLEKPIGFGQTAFLRAQRSMDSKFRQKRINLFWQFIL